MRREKERAAVHIYQNSVFADNIIFAKRQRIGGAVGLIDFGAGFVIDERVSVRDLLYGTILPSGADAAVGLAVYVSGSQEAFGA